MVRTAQNDNSNSVFCLKLLQNFPALLAKDSVLEMIQRLVRLPGGSLTLSSRKPQDVYKLKVHLPLEQIGLTRIHQGIHILQPHIGKQIPFLDEGRLHGLGCGGHGGAGTVGLHIHEIRGKIVNHREEDVIERLLLVLYIEQVMHMRNTDLRREARVDRTPFCSRLVEFLGSVIRIDDILGLHAQGLEISAKQGVRRILVQHPRAHWYQALDAMILAAGRGKRLRPLTDSVPKSLAIVGDHRLIEHHLLKLSRYGFGNVVINVSYLAEIIKEYLGDGTRYGIHIDYSTEPLQPLGTAGGIVNALEKFHSDRLLVINGDVYSDIEFSSHDLVGDIDAHLVLVPNPQHHIEGDFCLSGNKVGLPGSSSQRLERSR